MDKVGLAHRLRRRALFCLLLCLALLSLSACDDSTPAGVIVVDEPTGGRPVEPVDEVVLAYQKAASLNPLDTPSSYNMDLCWLVYDPLVELGEGMEPLPGLAQEWRISGAFVTLVLRDDVYFHNGRRLTAEDVAYTLQTVLQQGGNYAARLREVVDIQQLDTRTVRLELQQENRLFPALLNIPVLPLPQAGEVFEPVGTGKYIFYAAQERLVANADWVGGQIALKQIRLLDTPDAASAAFALTSGQITLLNAAAEGAAAGSIRHATNSLVYLGVNPACEALSTPELRQAASAALTRTTLLDDNIARGGYAAPSPIHFEWYLYASASVARSTDLAFTQLKLEQAGYTEFDDQGVRVHVPESGRSSRLSLRLLCNASNGERLGLAASIANQLRDCGYEVTVVEAVSADYFAQLQRGDFDLYLGEVRLTPNMDLSALVGSGGALNYGGFSATAVDYALQNLRTAQGEAQAQSAARLIAALDSEMPLIPLHFRQGELQLDERLLGSLRPTANSPYAGIESVRTATSDAG